MHGAIDADMAACGLWLLALRRSGVEAWKPGWEDFSSIPTPTSTGSPSTPCQRFKMVEESSLLPGLQRTLGTRRTKATFQGRKLIEIS